MKLTLKRVFYDTSESMQTALLPLVSGKITFELLISEQRPLKNLEEVFFKMKVGKLIKVAMIP